MMDQSKILNKQLQFENLLERTKTSILEALSHVAEPAKMLTGESFELLVTRHITMNAIGTEFEGKFQQTKDREFPDIIDNEYFGIEVKATKKDDWTSIGNSVLESSRMPHTKKIYVFFGKLGGVPGIKYRDYESCLKGIAVTHYPRYQIDMDIEDGKSIFSKMNTTYDEIATSDKPVKKIRDYYKSIAKPGDSLWWIDDDETMSAITSGPVVRSLSNLSVDERQKLLVDVYVTFPGILGSSTKKYESVATYLVTRHSAVSSNIRDYFSAGGVGEVVYKGEVIVLPRIAMNLLELAPAIEKALATADDSESIYDAWLKKIDRECLPMQLPVKMSDLFTATITSERDIT